MKSAISEELGLYENVRNTVFDHFVGLALKGLKKNKVLLRIIVKNVILRTLSIACNITDFNNLYKQYQIVHPNNSLRKVM